MVGGLEGGEEVDGEFDGGARVWWRGGEGREREVMEMNVGSGVRVPSLGPELGLAVVGGGAHEVDGEAAGGKEAREVEELVEVALCREGDYHHCNRCLCFHCS